MNKQKRILIMYTEGQTDEEFYKKLIQEIKKINNLSKFNFDKIIYRTPNGIGGMHNKMLKKFTKEICENSEYQSYEKVVCFCYDKDVFKNRAIKPPINREKMEKDFRANGADKVIHIVADEMIEDFFIIDYEGVKKFLKLGKNYKKPNRKGIELLKKMYIDSSNVYTKGEKAEGLVDALNMKLIMSKICSQIKPLCNELGCFCHGNVCKIDLTDKEIYH